MLSWKRRKKWNSLGHDSNMKERGVTGTKKGKKDVIEIGR